MNQLHLRVLIKGVTFVLTKAGQGIICRLNLMFSRFQLFWLITTYIYYLSLYNFFIFLRDEQYSILVC